MQPTATFEVGTEPDSSDEDGFNPPIVAIEYLESLGYRLREARLTNHEQGLQIHAVERIEDGSVADFSFVANMQCTAGMVLPHPVEWYEERLPLEEDDD